MSGSSNVQHSSHVRATRHLKRCAVGRRCSGRREHILDGSLQRQNVLDQSCDVLRYPRVMLLQGGLASLEGRRRNQIAVVAVVWCDGWRPWHRLGVDECVVDFGEVVQRLDGSFELTRQLVVGDEVEHLTNTLQILELI